MNSRVPSAAPPDVRRALTVLRQPPTSAQVVLDPVTTKNGEGAPLAGWHGVHRLTQAPFGPIVAATRAAARITERVAHGCIAASCSGAFAALHRRTPPERQGELIRIARSFMAAPAWRATRPLVDLLEVQVPAGVALVHERHVCCLIRLGRDHGACGTCPDIDPLERGRRTTAHAATAPRGTDLHLGVTHVA